MTSRSHPHLSLSASAESFRRFSQIKRKPAPPETSLLRYPAADLQDPHAPFWELRNNVIGGSIGGSEPDTYVRPRSSSPYDDTQNFWNSLNDSDSETERPPRVVRGRPRAHTAPSQLHSKRFFTLVRVPPPAIDSNLLASASEALRPRSLPEPTLIYVPDPANDVMDGMEDVAVLAAHLQDLVEVEEDMLPPPALKSSPVMKKSKSFRESTLDFIQKRKSTVPRPSIAFASITAPVPINGGAPRKYSALSMASTTNTSASVISLSAFPQPPGSIPPVPPMPSLEINSPKPDMDTPWSFILHVDPHLQPPDTIDASRPSSIGHVPAPPQSPPFNPSAEPAYQYTLQVDSPPGSPALAAAKRKAPMPTMPPAPERPREVHFDFGEPPDFDAFDETRMPTQRQLEEAAALQVISESGVRVPFGSLFREQKTIVCFIRHFWCPLCQDYMFSISRNVSPEVLRSAETDLVIISNGSYEMIKSYRRIFRSPFALYTDPTHKVYNALGMTLQTLDRGPKGNYVRHGMVGGIGMVVANAVKVGMPVWKEGGSISQLGGEFVLGPGITCSYVHRMRYTRSHIPILKVIEAAGVDMYTPLHRIESSTGGSFLGMSPDEESKWMDRRRKVLKRLRGKKMSRRGGTQYIETASTTTTSSESSSKRSSVQSQAAASLCSWDPSTEQAINVGLMGYETAIIQEAEKEEQMETGRAAGAELKVDIEPDQELEPEQHLEHELEPESQHNFVDTSSSSSSASSSSSSSSYSIRSDLCSLEAQREPEPEYVDSASIESDPRSESTIDTTEIMDDSKSELRYPDSFISGDDASQLGGMSSSETDIESTIEGQSSVQVRFDDVGVRLDEKLGEHVTDDMLSDRSYSSIGSGYDAVVDYHAPLFADKSAVILAASMSGSSLGSFERRDGVTRC